MIKQFPIIIIGMHRSGTSLLTRLLSDIGLFIGNDSKNPTSESKFFQNINKHLFKMAGASWDYPQKFEQALLSSTFRSNSLCYMQKQIDSPLLSNYLGKEQTRNYSSLCDIDFIWGWKDPRNTYTLNLWLELFPRAKVIHIYRHGVDVAVSLRHRERIKAEKINKRRPKKIKPRGRELGIRYISLELLYLMGGIKLWKTYIAKAKQQITKIDNAIEIQYECLLQQTTYVLTQLADFCSLDCTSTSVIDAAKSTIPQRAYAYKLHPELENFAKQVQKDLRLFDYNEVKE